MLTPDQKAAYQKITRFCAWQERAPEEVRRKLEKLQLENTAIEELVDLLIDEGFLDEERFARFFTGGKFRLKRWGKIKIAMHLRQKGIREAMVEKILDEEIDANAYYDVIKEEALKKERELKEELTALDKKAKVIRFLQSRGYENELAFKAYDEVSGPN